MAARPSLRLPLLAALLPAAVAVLLAAPSIVTAQSISVVVPATGAVRDAWQALEEGRLRDADAGFARALATSPDDTAALVGAGMVARRLGKTGRAREVLRHALRVDPALASATMLLGPILRESGDLEGALTVYEAALVRAPENAELMARGEECRQEAARYARWSGATSSHFRIFFDGPEDDDVAHAAMEVLEGAYQRVSRTLQVSPADPVMVVLDTRRESRIVDGAPDWSTAAFDGRIRVQVIRPIKDRVEFERVLGHEYVHAALRGVAPTGVPTWINEGLAALLEPDGPRRAERDLAGGRPLLAFSQLQESFASLPARDVTLAYAQSALAMRALIERAGIPAVLGLLADLAAGDRFDDAFAARAQMSFDEFQRTWLTSRQPKQPDLRPSVEPAS